MSLQNDPSTFCACQAFNILAYIFTVRRRSSDIASSIIIIIIIILIIIIIIIIIIILIIMITMIIIISVFNESYILRCMFFDVQNKIILSNKWPSTDMSLYSFIKNTNIRTLIYTHLHIQTPIYTH